MVLTLRASEAGYRRSRLRSLTVSMGLASCVAVSVLLSSVSADAHPHRHHSDSTPRLHPALVRVGTAKLRSAPGATAKTTALLDEGRSAVVVGHRDGWDKLRLDSGREGWVRHDLIDVAHATVKVASVEDHTESTRTRHARRQENDDDSPAPAHRAHARKVNYVVASAGAGRHRMARVVTSIPDAGAAESASSDTPSLADGDSVAPTVDSGSSAFSGRGRRLVEKALSYRGTPYRMGATGDGAFDCSGFTMYLFGKEGTSLPRTAAEQYDKGESVSRDHLRLGDLVFFRDTYKSGISHVGIYIGNNSFVHASGYGRGVRIDSLNDAFYINHWAGARRPH